MRQWKDRPLEVQTLFNPAFCGRLILSTITEYQNKSKRDFPFPLVYLILPLVIPSTIRSEISSRTQLLNWVQEHQELIYNLGKRARDFVEITNETIEFLMQAGLLKLTDMGDLSRDEHQGKLSINQFIDDEVKDCLRKAEHVGRWFAEAGKTETIYISLGVRP